MQWRGPYAVESHVELTTIDRRWAQYEDLPHQHEKYISKEPDVEGNVVPTDSKDGTTVAIAGVIHQDVDPELGELPDLEGYHQRDGSGETVDIAICVTHHHGEEEGWFLTGCALTSKTRSPKWTQICSEDLVARSTCQRLTLLKDIGRYLWHQKTYKTAFVTPDGQ